MSKSHSNSKYPWEKWFSRKTFNLVRGRDYDCSTITMQQQLRNQASERNKGVTIIETSNGLRVELSDEKRPYVRKESVDE